MVRLSIADRNRAVGMLEAGTSIRQASECMLVNYDICGFMHFNKLNIV